MENKSKKLQFTYMDYVKVNIELRQKKTVLNGKSATGKSYLYNIIEQYAQEEKRDDILCLDVDNVDMKNINHTLEKIKNIHDGIIIIDQADHILSDNRIYECVMKDQSNYYIIMSRKYFERYSELAKTKVLGADISLKYKLNVI